MSDLAKVVDYLYTRFLLRDVLAKATPGAIVLGATASLWWDWPTIFHGLSNLPVLLFAVLYAVAFLAGFTIQSLGSRVRVLTMFPRGEARPVSLQRMNEFRRRADDAQRQQHERFVVLKEMTGVASLALFLAILLHGTLKTWIDLPQLVVAVLLIGAVPVLLIEHYHQARQQVQWERVVLGENVPEERSAAMIISQVVRDAIAKVHPRKKAAGKS